MRAAAAGVWLIVVLAPTAQGQMSAYGMAAKVNGVGISNGQLERSFEEYLRDKGQNIAAMRYPERVKLLKRETLDLLIDQELAWQAAEQADAIASAQEVDAAIGEIRSAFRSEADFTLRLRMEGYTADSYREHIRHLVSAKNYLDRKAAAIEVSDAEVHTFYVENPAKFRVPERVHARHILLKISPDADEAEKHALREKLESVLHEARGGTDFAELARTYSQDATAGQGGDLGFFARGQMVQPFEEAAFALEPGEISGIVETPYGLHLIKMEERLPAKAIPEEEVRERVRQYLQSVKQAGAVKAELGRLRAEADIQVLVPLGQ